METKITQVFFGNDALPYKDKERKVHYPNVGSVFTGENNVTAIRFYVGLIGGKDTTTWIANIKKPNGQLSWRLLETDGVEDDGEVYVDLDISDLYTELKGAVQIGLNGYAGNINIEEDDGVYSVHGTPNILATGVIQIMVNYSPIVLPKTTSLSPTNEQLILAKLEQALKQNESIYVVDTLPQNANNFENGQMIYDKTTKLFYRVDNNQYVREDIDIMSIVIEDDMTLGSALEEFWLHLNDRNNPHQVTKAQVGLSEVVNTGDSAIPTINGTEKFTNGGAYELKVDIDNNRNAINTEVQARINAISSVRNDLAQETANRVNGDNDLENKLNAEIQARRDADNTKENVSNKARNFQLVNDTLYPSVKAVNDFVNSSINNVSAYYITRNAQGDAFESYNQLVSASQFYSGGQLRQPTRNDYCIVRRDEQNENATTRYIYQNGWQFQYVVNESPFTQAQLSAINSGIDQYKVADYEQGLLDIEKRIKYTDANYTEDFINGFVIDGQYKKIAEIVELMPNVSFVQSIGDLPSYNDNKLYFVLDNDALYRYGANNWVEISIYNPMNYVTTYSDQTINATKTFALGKGVAFATSGRLLELKAGFGGIGVYNLSGEEEELYNIGYLGITPYGEKSLGTENNKWANVYANKVNGRNVLQRFALTSDGHTIKLDNVVQTYQQIKALCEDIDNKDVILFFGDMILQPVADDGGGMCEFTTTFNYMGKTQLVRVSINQENQLKVKYVVLCELGDDDKIYDNNLLFATENEIRGLR